MVGSDMLERSRGGGMEGAHGDWKRLEVEANEMRGSRKGYKIYEESLMSETGKKSD
jgi:hypothetical protein